MDSFLFQSQPARVIFGAGTSARLAEEAELLGLRRLLVLCTPGHTSLAQRAATCLGDRVAGVFPGAKMHTPVDVTEHALAVAKEVNADGIVSIGGGSTIGLGKALALRTDLPQIVLPTTYAGSEMTPILGETRDGVKTTQRSPKVLPEVVIYDVELTKSLSLDISVLSAFNAMAHAVEALYAPDNNPIVSMMAEEGVRTIAAALPKLMVSPNDTSVRGDLLYGAWLCACCLGATTMGLHHKLCHTLGGLFNLPHAQMHTIILPYVLGFNSAAVPDTMARLGRALNVSDPSCALFELQQVCAAPLALRDIGMPREGIGPAVEQLMANPYKNPRLIEADAIETLLVDAWFGAGILPRPV